MLHGVRRKTNAFRASLLSVPPKIDDEFSSKEVTVRESANVSLKCRATGNPEPEIKWKRDQNLKIYTSPDDKGEY